LGWDKETFAVKKTDKGRKWEKRENMKGGNRVIREDKENAGKWKKEKHRREKKKKGRHVGELQTISDTEGKTR
jgi:hypothetical protein